MLARVIVLCLVASGSGTMHSASTSSSSNGMVSTTHHLATEAGVDMLMRGGNAADAAAAIQFMLGVVSSVATWKWSVQY